MKRSDYISWDEYFMGIAMLAAKRSKDPNTQVGACIVSPDNIIISTGYNGIMRIVLTQWIFGSYSDRSIALPCCYGTPSLMVSACIFEVAILHKFGI